MKKIHLTFLLLISGIFLSSFGPPNCKLFEGPCALSCIACKQAISHPQGSKASQEHFDKAIELCPSFSYAHYEKSVPYGKRGLMKAWKKMMDEAVALEPLEYLGIRGWDHFIWMRNYEACIADIERLISISPYDIGMTGDGTYHLNILRALAYKGLGDYAKASEIIEIQLALESHHVGLYDYLHLGVIQLALGAPEKALEAFDKQKGENNLSEVYFYSAQAYGDLENLEAQKAHLQEALSLYRKGKTMHNPYRQLMDRIYELDILGEIDRVGGRSK